MKICLLTPRFPFPENGGDVLRINNIARYLKSQSHQLVLVSFYDNEIEINDECKKLYDTIYTVPRSNIVSAINSLRFLMSGKPIQCGYYYSAQLLRIFKKVVETEKCDLYISHLLRMTPYLEKLNLQDKSIVEMTDALSKTYQLSSEIKGISLKKIIYKFEQEFIFRYEQKIVYTFKKVVLVSRNDIQYLSKKIKNNTSLSFHTNGVDCINTHLLSYQKNKICFVGNMRTIQNQDAVKFFVTSILPLIMESVPDVRFYIIGAEPPTSIRNLADGKNIFVTGFVESLVEFIQDSCVAVAPIRIAAGIQNKVLISMASGVPIVLSELISKAIPELTNGTNCFIANDAMAFADACIRLITNSELRNQISTAGYNLVLNNYSWQACLANYEQMR